MPVEHREAKRIIVRRRALRKNQSIAMVQRGRDFAVQLSLRSKLLLSLILVTATMTCCTLFVVRQSIQARAERQIEQDTRKALLTFQVMSQQQRTALDRKAELLATLAFLRDGDVTAVRDASEDPWQSEECDLFALVDSTGKTTALQTRNSELPVALANETFGTLLRSVSYPGSQDGKKRNLDWWVSGDHFYQVVVAPFYRDPPSNRIPLGKVIVGHEIDSARTKELARILSSDLVFLEGDHALASSLPALEEKEVSELLRPDTKQLQLGQKRYFVSSVVLAPESRRGLSLVVMKSDEEALASIARLNQLLLGLGLTAIILGGMFVYFVSTTFTKPLGSLVEGVRALEEGDFTYPLAPVGGDELARVTRAFESMRSTLQRNVAQKQQLEDELRQSQKMDALGRLAGGVAHDFNNLLTVIKGNTDLALDQIKPADPVRGNCEQISRVADRAASLTRQLLAFSRRQLLQPKVLDLNDLIVELSRLLRRLLREDIEYNVRLGESLGRVLADPGQMEQVLLNLTVNASDAMPEGGTVTIETQNVRVDDTFALTRASLAPGDYVLLAVTDSGHGMDAETKARIFEPFFTTKEPGKGTGLGLATVYGVVNQSSGFIHVDSSPGAGTRFEIYLPRTHELVQSAVLPEATSTKSHARETVLIAEDQDEVRALACEFLQSAGYSVLTAADGTEALAIGERLGSAIHVLITDVVMPRMRGPELARRLKDLLPHIGVVFISGYTEELGTTKPLEGGAFLQKPFSRDELLRHVSNALKAKRASQTDRKDVAIHVN
ncbi:MAG TPA: ATP-binding protein [Candidatus Sulfotelmatobacter sp.]|nr:ATP-binding protein [Candidatus Sulfotelmatobacter sp.]